MFHLLQFRAIITLEPGTLCYRRGGRAAEGPALEKQYPVKNGIVGPNPTLSARWADSQNILDKLELTIEYSFNHETH